MVQLKDFICLFGSEKAFENDKLPLNMIYNSNKLEYRIIEIEKFTATRIRTRGSNEQHTKEFDDIC